jgi:transposase
MRMRSPPSRLHPPLAIQFQYGRSRARSLPQAISGASAARAGYGAGSDRLSLLRRRAAAQARRRCYRDAESIPRQWKVIQHVREKFPCRDCEKISQAPAPFHVIARGLGRSSLLAMILFEKFGQHQPLNRQAERYAKEGVPISLSTLADQVGGCTVALTPLFKHQVPVLAKGKTDTGRIWVYVRDDKPFGGPAPPAAAEPASIPRRTWPPTPESSRPTPTAATASSTSPAARLAPSSKRPVGSTPDARSSSWPIWPRTPVA